ncbi:MAG: site-2 protease family protein, partial [bacterium]
MEIADDFVTGNAENSEEKPSLVGIRKDLDMYPGTTSLEGYPTYVIHDLYRHRFYNIGQTEFEILRRWHLGDADAIVEDILTTTTLYVNEDDINFLNDYLVRNELAIVESEAQREIITKNLDKKKPFNPASLFRMLMINVRLMRPDRFLSDTYWMVKFAFTSTFWWVMLVVFCAGIFLVIRDYSTFLAQAANIFTLQGATFIVIALVISKVFHEFGHAYMCKHLGLAVPKFGLRLMIILPFFYTDTNESWKLKSRRQRFMVGAGGILSECILAICSMFLWGILDDGPARNICFYLFVTSWISSLAINLTPFLRWDGYYMFSDLLGIPNLQSRGFGLGKWQLREWLFAWGDDVPLKLSPKMHRIVLFYAYGAWIKRTLVFLAIGILIYQRMFKVLGIFLLTLQLNFFIVKPIYTEVKHWIVNYKKMNWNKHSIGTLIAFLGLLAILFVPWQVSIRVPATVSPRVQAILYTPDNAQVTQVNIERGDKVTKGQVLAQFGNSNLEYDIRLAKSNVDILEGSLSRFGDQA